MVQRLHGAAEIAGAHQSMIVTTSFFTKSANEEQRRIKRRMDLADYHTLNGWLARYRKVSSYPNPDVEDDIWWEVVS